MKRRAVIGLLLLATLAGGGLAIAQQQQGGGESGEGTAANDVRERANLSGPEQAARARVILARGVAIGRRILSMLDGARRENNIILADCLNDKVTQVHVAGRAGADHRDLLDQAIQSGNDEGRNHQFTMISILSDRFNVLEQEANQCLGTGIFETGATTVTTTIDPSTPDEEIDEAFNWDTTIWVIPPDCASCVR